MAGKPVFVLSLLSLRMTTTETQRAASLCVFGHQGVLLGSWSGKLMGDMGLEARQSNLPTEKFHFFGRKHSFLLKVKETKETKETSKAW